MIKNALNHVLKVKTPIDVIGVCNILPFHQRFTLHVWAVLFEALGVAAVEDRPTNCLSLLRVPNLHEGPGVIVTGDFGEPQATAQINFPAVANVGPGLGPIIGPAGNFSSLSDVAKWALALGMLLGRLEILTVAVLFHPQFWRY